MTKDRLRNYQNIKREREQIQQLLDEAEAALYYPNVPHLTDMPRAQVFGNPKEDKANDHLELIARYKAKLAELAAEQLAIETAIESLDQTYRLLMRYRYFQGIKWEEICTKMGYCWTQIHEHHSRALKLLKGAEE